LSIGEIAGRWAFSREQIGGGAPDAAPGRVLGLA
jgi:hypothetical protein